MSGSLFGPTSPKGGGGGAGGGTPLVVRDEGIVVDPATNQMDFVGAGVTVTSTGPGAVQVSVPGLGDGLWAGHTPSAAFAGAPLVASVVFPFAHPSGAGYSVAVDELVTPGSGLSLDLSVENKTAMGFDIVLNTMGPVVGLIGVDWQVQPSTMLIPGVWAGSELAVAFGGAPLTATVVFGSPHPSGTDYAIALDEIVVPGSGFSLDLSIENKTANGFDIVLNTGGPIPNLIQVDWQVQPYGTTPGPSSGDISLPGLQNTIIVDRGSNVFQNGTQQFPFHSVQAAIAVAIAGQTVLVYPGIYTEQITAKTGVRVVGLDRDNCIIQNIGANAGNTPLADAPTDIYNLENLTIQPTVVGNTIWRSGGAAVPKLLHQFKNVKFYKGIISEISSPNSTGVYFTQCIFADTLGFNMTGAMAAVNVIFCTACEFTGSPTFVSTRFSTSTLILREGCIFSGVGAPVIGGGWSFKAENSQLGWVTRTTFNALNQVVEIYNCVISGGLHFTAQPLLTKILNNTFVDTTPIGTADITTTFTLANVVYENNAQVNGIAGWVRILSDIRRVGGNLDNYFSLQDALTSVVTPDVLVSLQADVALTAPLTLPTSPVKIDGNGKHLLAGPVVGQLITTVNLGESVSFENIELEGEINVIGAGAVLRFVKDVTLTGRINLSGGDSLTRVELSESEVYGNTTWGYGIRLAAELPVVVIDHCFVRGFAAINGGTEEAIYWDAGVQNDNLRLKYSVLRHGSLAFGNPFGRDAVQTPLYRSHHCAYNSDPENLGIWTNVLAPGQRFDTLDPAADY